MFLPLKQRRLSQGVVSELLAAIRAGQFAPGDKLPSERELAEAFHVSRVSVREGLRILELLEQIVVRQGKGSYVRSPEVRPGGALLRHWLLAHQEEVLELLEVREALETKAAASAAERAVVISLPDQPEEADITSLVQADIDFHNSIADASGNVVLASLIKELNGVLEESRFAMFALPERPFISQTDHKRIVEAIERRNPDAAEIAMREHIRRARDEINHLDDNEEQG